MNETVSVIQTKDNFWLFEFVVSPWVHGSVNFWERVVTDTSFFLGGEWAKVGRENLFPHTWMSQEVRMNDDEWLGSVGYN